MPDAGFAPPGSPLVEVRGLKVHFPIHAGLLRRRVGAVRAVDGVDFTLRAGETLGLVGESGCGKSTTGRALLRLLDPTEGSIRVEGIEIARMGQGRLRSLRPRMQMVFQDPQASLDPRMTVEAIIREPLDEHTRLSRAEKASRVRQLMDAVGLSRRFAGRYPHAFSGGQRQRVGIARALALNPALVVCDEPIAALDVSIQAQVVNLLKDLQARLGLSYLFIAHDLAVVKHVADRVAVMYLGRIVEIGPKDDVFANPRHPYTRVLLSAIPRPDPHRKLARSAAQGDPGGDMPSPANVPPGCRFHTRCPFAIDRCRTEDPALHDIEPGHFSACHLAEDLPPMPAAEAAQAATPAAARRLALYADRRAAQQVAG